MYPPTYLPAHLSICLFFNLSSQLPALKFLCLQVYLPYCLFGCQSLYLPYSMSVHIPICLSVYSAVDLSASLTVCMSGDRTFTWETSLPVPGNDMRDAIRLSTSLAFQRLRTDGASDASRFRVIVCGDTTSPAIFITAFSSLLL